MNVQEDMNVTLVLHVPIQSEAIPAHVTMDTQGMESTAMVKHHALPHVLNSNALHLLNSGALQVLIPMPPCPKF
jgi:predicted urease superfamily metal-dependent hydrolase